LVSVAVVVISVSPKTVVAESFTLLRAQRFSRDGRMTDVVIRFKELVIPDSVLIEKFTSLLKMLRISKFEKDEMRNLPRFFKFRTSFQSGMTSLHNLMIERKVFTNEGIAVHNSVPLRLKF